MALITVKPSLASGKYKSASRTLNCSVEISLNASLMEAAGATANPRLSKPSCNATRTSFPSSARRILVFFILFYAFQKKQDLEMRASKTVMQTGERSERRLTQPLAIVEV